MLWRAGLCGQISLWGGTHYFIYKRLRPSVLCHPCWRLFYFYFLFGFWDRVLLCNAGWPWATIVVQAGLELVAVLLPLHSNARVRGSQHYTQCWRFLSQSNALLEITMKEKSASMNSDQRRWPRAEKARRMWLSPYQCQDSTTCGSQSISLIPGFEVVG